MLEQQKVILHADLDAFYASVEQRDRPELRGQPVAVGGTGPRGVVSAASYEARRFGVHSAMPSFEARRLCPELVFLRGNMALYQQESRKVFQIFRLFSPKVEGLSLDEAFLDLTGTERLLGRPREVGDALRVQVRDMLDLPLSVGIAPVKMVAKIASETAKPDGLFEVMPGEVSKFLDPLPVHRIWGVGIVAQGRLQTAGFYTLGDLARAADSTIKDSLGDWGIEMARLARGDDSREVDPYRRVISYGEENTFENDVEDLGVLESAIRSHAESVARRLRRDGVRALTVVLKWKAAQRVAPGPRGYPVRTRRMTLAQAVDDGAEITAAAKSLLSEKGPGEPVRLIGVSCTNLIKEHAFQLPVFPRVDGEKRKKLNQTVDRISERFGKEALRRASREETARAGLSIQIKHGDGGD
jgi:DNA polymerase-4